VSLEERAKYRRMNLEEEQKILESDSLMGKEQKTLDISECENTPKDIKDKTKELKIEKDLGLCALDFFKIRTTLKDGTQTENKFVGVMLRSVRFDDELKNILEPDGIIVGMLPTEVIEKNFRHYLDWIEKNTKGE